MPGTSRRGAANGGSGPARTVRVRPQTVRAGVTSFAALAGLSCYVFLAQWHVNSLLAGAAGFVFALMVRVAAGSLAREWLAAHTEPRPPAPRDRLRSDQKAPRK